MIDIQYKAATDKDFPLLFKLDTQAFNRSFDTNFKNVEELTGLLKNTTIEIAYYKNNPVGYYSYSYDKNEIEIIGVVVIPEYQRMRAGSQMLTKILNVLNDRGRIKIVTHPKNIAATNLYKKFGFTVSHIDPSYYGENEPRVIMYKNKR